jgi:ankyrin repeat protein
MSMGTALTARVVAALFMTAALAVIAASTAFAQGAGVDIFLRTPLADAAAKGDAARIRGMLASGQSPNAFDLYGRPAILLAAWGNHVDAVEALVEGNVRVDDRDKTGATALLVAADRGYDRIAELLIKGKANVNLDNRQGVTPLMLAAKNGHLSVVEILVKAGARLDLQDHTGRTALEWADANNRRPVAQYLRRAGARS